jgi:hypothetical protein
MARRRVVDEFEGVWRLRSQRSYTRPDQRDLGIHVSDRVRSALSYLDRRFGAASDGPLHIDDVWGGPTTPSGTPEHNPGRGTYTDLVTRGFGLLYNWAVHQDPTAKEFAGGKGIVDQITEVIGGIKGKPGGGKSGPTGGSGPIPGGSGNTIAQQAAEAAARLAGLAPKNTRIGKDSGDEDDDSGTRIDKDSGDSADSPPEEDPGIDLQGPPTIDPGIDTGFDPDGGSRGSSLPGEILQALTGRGPGIASYDPEGTGGGRNVPGLRDPRGPRGYATYDPEGGGSESRTKKRPPGLRGPGAPSGTPVPDEGDPGGPAALRSALEILAIAAILSRR